ncbi:pathogen-associated molecular patterns-induced protein A70-like [Solanum dulcamara]|uniref:pathogen-associated molecular patterns-induced protein A70-like n=1 Tax=Solanum dulcamara TaxID=45834 RepID=UPI002484DB9A|nr:pathogen-associated molecular patterns-induced protein A70-like [Solanum dulcamara]XP_055820434.1 pathogen-associated molecular patterns-induced protein A70-like [Solanum dulcamara]XP_055820435.1 pathogen-associated molecular patterns-induced protein A70-like [Solanum dulcamara]
MFDDSVSTVYSSIWTSMNSWFTPTVLFVLLNVMIGTIAFTSSLASQKQNHPKQQQQHHQQEDNPHQHEDYSQNHPQQQQPTKLARSPSLLQRIKSINFYNYRSQEPVKDYDFEHPHQQETPFEPPTHYIFEQAPEHTTIQPDTTAQYIFNQENNVQKAQSQYDFHQTHQENLPDTQTQYLFQHTHEQKLGNMEPDFHFEESLPDKSKSTQYIFQQSREQKLKDMDTHFDFQQFEKENEDDEEEEGEIKSLDEVYSQLRERHVSRSRSDTKPSAGEAPVKLPTKMRKSASMKSPFAHFEEEAIVEARRPATTREKSAKTSDEDNEVDAKADDFINKFKQQLKLQRLDSILKYKEMIGGGS